MLLPQSKLKYLYHIFVIIVKLIAKKLALEVISNLQKESKKQSSLYTVHTCTCFYYYGVVINISFSIAPFIFQLLWNIN